VLQTGEYDYAWNLQVEDDILLRMEQGGKGRVNIWQPATSSTPCATSAIR
jgi:peptide/nickel transport system substrate-binding protein